MFCGDTRFWKNSDEIHDTQKQACQGIDDPLLQAGVALCVFCLFTPPDFYLLILFFIGWTQKVGFMESNQSFSFKLFFYKFFYGAVALQNPNISDSALTLHLFFFKHHFTTDRQCQKYLEVWVDTRMADMQHIFKQYFTLY